MCLIVGDELWLYYSAYAGDPDRAGLDWRVNGTYGQGAVGLAKLRRDGFVSMRAMFPGAVVQTRKLKFIGSHLYVNANTSGQRLTVQVINEAGQPIEGLTHEDCLGFCGNSTKNLIVWKNKTLVGLGDRKIQLQFKMDRGDLFSFWITDDSSGQSGGYIAAGGPGLSGAKDDS
jgi:hypothetical protein